MPVSIRLGQDLEERLTKASRKLRVNKSAVIKRSVEAYLTTLEPGRSPYELGQDCSALTSVQGSDLFTTFKRRLRSRPVQSIVVDAGPLIALFHKRDKHHLRVKRFLATATGRLVSTLPVVTEVCHFLNAKGKLALLAWIRRGGLSVQPIVPDDFQEIATIIQRYADREIDFADATLVWLAELLNTIDVLTIDRADFQVYRSPRGKAFNLVLS